MTKSSETYQLCQEREWLELMNGRIQRNARQGNTCSKNDDGTKRPWHMRKPSAG
jgi:hypothetical protein